MGNCLNTYVSSESLADRLGLIMIGENRYFNKIAAINSLCSESLSFSNGIIDNEKIGNVTIIAAKPYDISGITTIMTKSPRLSFARALNILNEEPGFIETDRNTYIDSTACISNSASIGKGVSIGARTIIGHNVVIADAVTIGKDCIIKSNSVIGEAGFGFERDESNLPIRVLHLGNVVIGDRVEIGSLNTICKSTLNSTIIEDDVKTDDHVHIAHNCRIGKGTLICASVEISGGVDIGKYVWIGPGSSILNKVFIGDSSFIGIASNVTKSTAPMTRIAGNPARVLPT